MDGNKFKDAILEELSELAISDTQKYRVLKVRDHDTNAVLVSAQKWWRKDANAPWVAGKGFKLTPDMAVVLGQLMVDGGRKIQAE